MITLLEGDCLELMPTLTAASVDLILCDLPYGTTQCHWDSVIPLQPLWQQYERLLKPNGAIVLTASQPFTSQLVMSKPEWFKYAWIWQKNNATGHLNAKRMPMKLHEDIIVFGQAPAYYPQDLQPYNKITRRGHNGNNFGKSGSSNFQAWTNYPRSILQFDSDTSKLHPTQKPLALFDYLIRTYTVEGDTVLDNCAGSGTTGLACKNLNRSCILMEKDAAYIETIKQRIAQPLAVQSAPTINPAWQALDDKPHLVPACCHPDAYKAINMTDGKATEV